MWNHYAGAGGAVALKTTYQLLDQCLNEDVYLGKVEYVDFVSAVLPDTDMSPFLHKRRSFAHELEVRALTTWSPNATGYRVVSDVGLVQTTMTRYGLNVPVCQSSMDSDPIY